MSHRDNVDQQFGVVDGIEYSIIADTNPPIAVRARQFDTASRSRFCRECFDSSEDAKDDRLGKSFQLFSRRSGEDDQILIH